MPPKKPAAPVESEPEIEVLSLEDTWPLWKDDDPDFATASEIPKGGSRYQTATLPALPTELGESVTWKTAADSNATETDWHVRYEEIREEPSEMEPFRSPKIPACQLELVEEGQFLKAIPHQLRIIFDYATKVGEFPYPHDCIYPQKDGKPVCNPAGKYFVKLFLCGAWRKVVIDDRFPFVEDRCLLPTSHVSCEIWPQLLCKALLTCGPSMLDLESPFGVTEAILGRSLRIDSLHSSMSDSEWWQCISQDAVMGVVTSSDTELLERQTVFSLHSCMALPWWSSINVEDESENICRLVKLYDYWRSDTDTDEDEAKTGSDPLASRAALTYADQQVWSPEFELTMQLTQIDWMDRDDPQAFLLSLHEARQALSEVVVVGSSLSVADPSAEGGLQTSLCLFHPPQDDLWVAVVMDGEDEGVEEQRQDAEGARVSASLQPFWREAPTGWTLPPSRILSFEALLSASFLPTPFHAPIHLSNIEWPFVGVPCQIKISSQEDLPLWLQMGGVEGPKGQPRVVMGTREVVFAACNLHWMEHPLKCPALEAHQSELVYWRPFTVSHPLQLTVGAIGAEAPFVQWLLYAEEGEEKEDAAGQDSSPPEPVCRCLCSVRGSSQAMALKAGRYVLLGIWGGLSRSLTAATLKSFTFHANAAKDALQLGEAVQPISPNSVLTASYEENPCNLKRQLLELSLTPAGTVSLAHIYLKTMGGARKLRCHWQREEATEKEENKEEAGTMRSTGPEILATGLALVAVPTTSSGQKLVLHVFLEEAIPEEELQVIVFSPVALAPQPVDFMGAKKAIVSTALADAARRTKSLDVRNKFVEMEKAERGQTLPGVRRESRKENENESNGKAALNDSKTERLSSQQKKEAHLSEGSQAREQVTYERQQLSSAWEEYETKRLAINDAVYGELKEARRLEAEAAEAAAKGGKKK